MKTSKVSRYFLVLLCALGCNAAWGQNTMKIFFNEYNDKAAGPTLSCVGKPDGVEVTQSGFTWGLYYYVAFGKQAECTDRVVVKESNVTPSTASISFSGFKYEVKQVQWNRMCDRYADVPDVETALIPEIGDEIPGKFTERRYSFSVQNFPNTNSKLGFNGLKSIVINDKIVSDCGRVFLKAGTGDNYAFKITYYEPSVDLSSVPDQIECGKNYDVSKDCAISHPGAFNFTTTYKSSDTNIFTVDKKSGVIKPKNLGTANITVVITDIDGKVKKENTKAIQVVAPTLNQNQYLVALKYCDGTDNGETVIATYGQKLPNGLTAPTREGYKFKGYYSNENQEYAESVGQDYGGTLYYDKNMVGVKPWDKAYNGAAIYAHWAPRTYTVTFDLNDESHEAIFPDDINAKNADRNIDVTSDGKMNVEFVFGKTQDNSIDLSVPKKPGYEMLGWYDDNDDLIVTVDAKNRHSYITDANGYWQKDNNNLKWNYAHDLVLKAKYRCKFTVEQKSTGPIIRFGTAKKKEIVEPKTDWLSSVVSDLVGAAKEVGTKQNPVMTFDLRNSKNVWTGGNYDCQLVMKTLQGLDYISPNVLVYFNDESYYADKCNNAILSDYTCPNLYVKDRYEIKVPHPFKANKALYERNKGYSGEDAAKAQAANSEWGTLCLPYPIRNNANNVKFYQLAGFEKSVMHYTPMNEDVIPANTPVLYKRLQGVGSEVKIEEAGVDVPVNTSYSTNSGASLDSWQFIGTLNTKIFCGKDYDKKKMPAGAVKVDGSQEIYYFKQDKFTHLANDGKVTVLPYRAYFTTTEASATKFNTFSIIAIDEEGATDITNLIDNDAEGDGKIYDLNGRRVMQPVSGRLYIVNGKKKVY